MSKFNNLNIGVKIIIILSTVLILVLSVATIVTSNVLTTANRQNAIAETGITRDLSIKLVNSEIIAMEDLALNAKGILDAMYPGDYKLANDGTFKDMPTLYKGSVNLYDQDDFITNLFAKNKMDISYLVEDKGKFKIVVTSLNLPAGRESILSQDKIDLLKQNKNIVYTTAVDGKRMFLLAVPIIINNKLSGYISIAQPMETLIELVKSAFKEMTESWSDGYIMVIGYDDVSQGEFLYHPTSIGKKSIGIPHMDKLRDTLKTQKRTILNYTNTRSQSVMASAGMTDIIPWMVAVVVEGTALDRTARTVQAILIPSIVATIVFVILFTVFLLKKLISTPLREVNHDLEMIADGDMTNVLDVNSEDEIGILSKNLNHTVEQLNDVLKTIQVAAKEVYEGANDVGRANEEMAAGAEQQSKSTTSVSSTIEEMSSSVISISQLMQTTTEESNKVREVAESGQVVLQDTVKSIHDLNKSISQSARNVVELSEASDRISTVLQVITDIADQTNLLALNAAIEAARAGDAGRGFAVVADEVRKLAEKTVSATQEISQTIVDIQDKVKVSTKEMETSVQLAESGRKSTDTLNQEINKIIQGVVEISDELKNVVTIVGEQSIASEEINTHIHEVAAAANENAQLASENINKVDELKELAQGLLERVSRFHLR